MTYNSVDCNFHDTQGSKGLNVADKSQLRTQTSICARYNFINILQLPSVQHYLRFAHICSFKQLKVEESNIWNDSIQQRGLILSPVRSGCKDAFFVRFLILEIFL